LPRRPPTERNAGTAPGRCRSSALTRLDHGKRGRGAESSTTDATRETLLVLFFRRALFLALFAALGPTTPPDEKNSTPSAKLLPASIRLRSRPTTTGDTDLGRASNSLLLAPSSSEFLCCSQLLTLSLKTESWLYSPVYRRPRRTSVGWNPFPSVAVVGKQTEAFQVRFNYSLSRSSSARSAFRAPQQESSGIHPRCCRCGSAFRTPKTIAQGEID